MPLQSETSVEWDQRGWHGFLLDTGCTLWDKCTGCPLPICAEDVGRAAARREAIRVGITPMQRTYQGYPQEHPRNDDDYIERLQQCYYQGLTLEEAMRACDLGRIVTERIYNSFGPRPGRSRPQDWTSAMWGSVR